MSVNDFPVDVLVVLDHEHLKVTSLSWSGDPVLIMATSALLSFHSLSHSSSPFYFNLISLSSLSSLLFSSHLFVLSSSLPHFPYHFFALHLLFISSPLLS